KKKKKKAEDARLAAKSQVVPIHLEEMEPLIEVEPDPPVQQLHAPPTPTLTAPQDDTPAKSTTSSIQSHLRVNPDKLLDSYGKYGRMQLLGHFLCQYLTLLYSASLFVVTYTSNEPETTCVSSNGTLISNACDHQSECVDGTYNNTDTKPVGSIFIWYNITCGNKFLIEAGATSYVMGAMIVVPIFCRLADKYGRKPLLLISLYSSLFINCIIPVAPWYPFYIVLRFLLGATSDAYLSISALLTVELICQDARPIITLLSTTGFALGLLWIGFLSLFISDWQYLYTATIAPGFLTVIYFCCLTESPYWLASHDQTHDLKDYCKKANKMNGTNVNYRECIEEKGKPPEHHVRFRDLLKHRDIIKGIAINGLAQFTLSTSYYSISFMATRITASTPTLGFMILAAAEIPGGVLSMVLMNHFGRRTLVVVSFIMQGLSLFATPFLGSEVAVLIALSFLKVFNTICFAVHPIFVAESVPTSVRSLVASIVNIPQSAGMLLGPFFKYATDWNPHISYIGLAIQSAVAGGILMFLKETKGMDLPEDLDDLNRDRSQYNRRKISGSQL
ncbi:hypothetical protein PFISCL1PPCAC_23866, partial [Pristionchus fissidentatus]